MPKSNKAQESAKHRHHGKNKEIIEGIEREKLHLATDYNSHARTIASSRPRRPG